jgi:NAD(P)-dependent dehydrogenase (short-subunit alcohol dehydrogenase family)
MCNRRFIGKGKESLMTKTVLITGAGSGFGLGASLELARRGYDVIATTQIVSQITAVNAAAGVTLRVKSSMSGITQIVSEPKSGTLTCW